MKVTVDECVGCPPNMGCLGSGCPYKNSYYYECDHCGAEYVDYRIDDIDLCDECADKYLNELFNECTIAEKAEMLDVDYKYSYYLCVTLDFV